MFAKLLASLEIRFVLYCVLLQALRTERLDSGIPANKNFSIPIFVRVILQAAAGRKF